MLRIGIIGAGIICAAHTEAIAADDRVMLAAVTDIDAARAQEAAVPFGAHVYTDYEKMLADEKLDAAIINLPHHLHEACAEACAQKGVHILVEKPMANTVAECERMIDAANRAGVVLQIAHIQHYYPENRAAKAIVQSGQLGRLLMIHDLRTSNYFLPTRPKWFLQKAQAGGGLMMNFGAHSVDKIMYLSGSEPMDIQGLACAAQPGVDVDGNAQVFLRMESGISATITLCGYAVEPVNETTLYFERGALRLRTGEGLWQTQGSGYVPVDASAYPPPFTAQLDDFIDAIQTHTKPECDGDWGLRVIRTIQTVYAQS